MRWMAIDYIAIQEIHEDLKKSILVINLRSFFEIFLFLMKLVFETHEKRHDKKKYDIKFMMK